MLHATPKGASAHHQNGSLPAGPHEAWQEVVERLRLNHGSKEGALQLFTTPLGAGQGPRFFLCHRPGATRLTWSSRLQPLRLSVADAVGLAPAMKFVGHQVYVFEAAGNAAIQGDENDGEVLARLRQRVAAVVQVGYCLYEELLAAAGVEDLAVAG